MLRLFLLRLARFDDNGESQPVLLCRTKTIPPKAPDHQDAGYRAVDQHRY